MVYCDQDMCESKLGRLMQAFPSGALHMLRRNLEEVAGGKVGFYDEVANG